jgi:glutathione synthase/RimK-type ligase-like ATP-grasp enzyme
MTRLDVALATCHTLPEDDPDASPLLAALAAAGLSARSLAWDDPDAPFADARFVLLRSTWNYVHHLDAFLTWVDGLGERVVNPAAIVRWNHHKRYLADLAAHGVPVIPTEYVARASGRRVADVMAARGWSHAVAKPAVSAGSFETRALTEATARAEAAWFDGVLVAREMMVQPYVRSVEAYGERSVVWIDGAVTHSIRKSPRLAGQSEHVSEAVPVADDERTLALSAVRAAGEITGAMPTYARVDMVRDAGGALQVMELELIEPSLFFVQGPAACARLAAAFARRS